MAETATISQEEVIWPMPRCWSLWRRHGGGVFRVVGIQALERRGLPVLILEVQSYWKGRLQVTTMAGGQFASQHEPLLVPLRVCHAR